MSRRVGLVRGPFLNPYDMAQFTRLDPEFDPVGIGARRCFTESADTGVAVRRLRCPETEVSLRFGRRLNMATWFFGAGYTLVGLDAALADCDIVHTAETYFGFSLQAARAAARRRRPLVVTVKETIAHIEALHPIRRHGRESRVKDEVRDATAHFVAVSGAAATALELEGVDRGRITVVHPAVDTAAFDLPRLPAAGLRVLFVGPAVWRKGVFDAVLALALLRRQSAASLTIVGGGSDLAAVRRLAERLGVADSVHLVGHLPHRRMPAIMAAADVLLAPSIPTRTWQEQDSMAIVEAMAAGLPVVATSGGVRSELLGAEGWWVAPGEPREAAARLLEVAEQPALASARAHLLRERARRNHDIAVAGTTLSSVYRAVSGSA